MIYHEVLLTINTNPRVVTEVDCCFAPIATRGMCELLTISGHGGLAKVSEIECADFFHLAGLRGVLHWTYSLRVSAGARVVRSSVDLW
jgi:hypothetical protein